MIKNGEFLQKDEKGLPRFWQVWPKKKNPSVYVGIDNTNSKSGGQSVCIRNPHEKYYTRVDQLNVPCKPHTRYIASFWCKGLNISTTQKGGARMFIGPNGQLGRPITSFGPGLELFKRTVPDPWTFGWTKYESPIFNSGTSTSLGVTLFLNRASGTVWFDQVEIREYNANARLNRDAERARELISKDIQELTKIAPELKQQLSGIRKSLPKFMPPERDPRKGMPFFEPQRKMGVLFARFLSKKYPGKKLLLTQAADPLKRQSAFIIPGAAQPESVTLRGLKNEVETFAVNVTNISQKPETLKISVPEHLEMKVFSAVHVETDRKEAVDDALLPVDQITVFPGMTCQLYFSTHLKYAKSGTIRIGAQKIKVDCRPKKTAIPEKLPLIIFGYAYPYSFSFFDRIDQARSLRYHLYHNGAMPYQYCSPMPYFDANGKFIPSKMNWGKLDLILSMTRAPQRLVIPIPTRSAAHIKEFLGTHKGKAIALGSPEWERRLVLWLKALVKGLKRRHISYDRFALTLIDEPSAEYISFMKTVAAVVRKTDKNIRIYNNFHHGIPAGRLAEFLSVVDIAAPEIAEMTPQKMAIMKKSGKELWCYHVQNRSYPADKMRDFFARMRKEDVVGYSYWCFFDRSPRWRPTGGQSYAVLYDDAQGSWHPSKRAEGIREGVELFTLLTLVREQNPAQYEKLCAQLEQLPYSLLRDKALNIIE